MSSSTLRRLGMAAWLFASAAAAAAQIELSGWVHTESGTPIAGAHFELLARETVAGRALRELSAAALAPLASSRSGDDGRFVIEVPRPGVFKLTATHSGHLPMEINLQPIADSAEVPELRMPTGAPLRLHVRDAAGAGRGGWALVRRPRQRRRCLPRD